VIRASLNDLFFVLSLIFSENRFHFLGSCSPAALMEDLSCREKLRKGRIAAALSIRWGCDPKFVFEVSER
jgi:hypothetical protein